MQKLFDEFFEGSFRRLMEMEWKNDVLDASCTARAKVGVTAKL